MQFQIQFNSCLKPWNNFHTPPIWYWNKQALYVLVGFLWHTLESHVSPASSSLKCKQPQRTSMRVLGLGLRIESIIAPLDRRARLNMY